MRPLILLTAGVLLVTGCGGLADQRAASDVPSGQARPGTDKIPGAKVGAMAEHQLEVMHPGMAVGRITCPDLVFVAGGSVRCERIAELSGGRRVRVSGTVTVISVVSGGRLHVQLDDVVTEFGVTGEQLASDLTTALVARRAKPTAVRCPYLTGKPGVSVRCRVRADGRLVRIRVVVTGVDPTANLTRYRFDWRSLSSSAQRSLAFVATKPSDMVDLAGDHRSRAAA